MLAKKTISITLVVGIGQVIKLNITVYCFEAYFALLDNILQLLNQLSYLT